MTNIFTAESFGAELPANWENICDTLNAYAEEHPDMNPNDIWENYWNGTFPAEKETETKRFDVDGTEVEFWYEGTTLFCQIPDMGQDVYCCGNAKMPETEEDVYTVTKSAWVW